jgi:hypothetical protein
MVPQFTRSNSISQKPSPIELDTVEFATFVAGTISEHVVDGGEVKAVFENLKHQVGSLCQHASSQGRKLCSFQEQKTCQLCSNTNLGEIALSLKTVVEMTPNLPANVTAQVHSFIGMLIRKQGNLKGAIDSFLKALWIQTSLCSNEQVDTPYDGALDIALTRHRLGVAYGKSGKFAEACTLLEQALTDYQTSQGDSDKNKRLMVLAQAELDKFVEANEIEATLGIPGADDAAQKRKSRRRREHTTAPLPASRHSSSDLLGLVTETLAKHTPTLGTVRRSYNSLTQLTNGTKLVTEPSPGSSRTETTFRWSAYPADKKISANNRLVRVQSASSADKKTSADAPLLRAATVEGFS